MTDMASPSVPFFPSMPVGVWVPCIAQAAKQGVLVESMLVVIGHVRKHFSYKPAASNGLSVPVPIVVTCNGAKLILKEPGPINKIKWAFPMPDFKIPKKPLKDLIKIETNEMVTFRVIPHANVTNNNKRLWKSIEQMYAMYGSIRSRIEREGFKFRYREKDSLWFDILFRQDDGKRAIEFYLTTTAYQAEKLKRKFENKMDVTLEQATDVSRLQVPKENTLIQEMRYTNHDIFSLNTNTNDTKTPIASILNVVDELQFDGDFARVSFCLESENRNKWVKNASWALEKMQKGKVPQRAGAGNKKAVAAAKTFVGGLVNEINDLIADTFQAFSNVFFKSEKSFKKEKVIKKAYSLEDEIKSTHANAASHEKINIPVMKTRIRVAAHSDDRLIRETLSESLSLAYSELSDNNELRGVKVRIRSRHDEIIDELNTFRLSKRTKYDVDTNLISTDELAKLVMQMPGAELQRKYDDALSAKTRIEADVPSVMRSDAGMYLGVSEMKDQEIGIRMPMNPDEFYRAYTFIGGQGAGKDTAIKNWVVEGCLQHGISFIIPEVIVEEGERGMADGIRDSLPPDKVIDLDLADGEYVVPMDLTEVITKLGREGASRFGDEVIDFFGDMESLARSKRYLRAAAKAAGGSLYNIKRLIEDENFRMDTIEQLQGEGNTRLAEELISWGTGDDLGGKADAVLNRLDDFFGNDKLFDVFSQQPKPEVDFARWMREGKVVIIRIPVRKLGQVAARTLVHWITLKTFMTRMLMAKAEQENGCFMVFNEPEQYATEGLTRLMGRIGTEGRKERLGSLYAFHHWNKLPSSLQENLQGGGVQQFLFMNDHMKTFELSRHRFEQTIPLEEAVHLPAHYAIVSVRAGGAVQPAFICHMAPPISKRFPQYDNSFLTKRHARMFGRHWKELQQQAI